LQEYLRENGEAAPAGVPNDLLRMRCAEVASRLERDFERHRNIAARSSATVQHVPMPMPPAGGAKKKAFICGINYMGTSSQLSGCINDARCMHYLLRHRFEFRDEHILFMADDHPDPSRRPTRVNMMQGLAWLMTGLNPGDSLLFHYSGHGGQERDYRGEERDGMNETLLPLDHKYAGQIPDWQVNQMIVQPLPQGVKLHAIIDSCHSGSMLDLPYIAPCHNGMLQWQAEYNNSMVAATKGTAGGFAVQFSASADHEYAADTASLSGGVPTGAATFSFIQALEKRGLKISYGDLVLEMYHTLMTAGLGQNGMPMGSGGGGMDGIFGMLLGGAGRLRGQTPSISANYAFDFSAPFII